MNPMQKPDRKTAMVNLIALAKQELPFDAPESKICGDSCVGCPKKLLELVEIEIIHWEHMIDHDELPNLTEISRFGKLCKNVRRGLVRNGILANAKKE